VQIIYQRMIAVKKFKLHELKELLFFFSDSLLKKQSEDQVLWDIAKNCISKLGFVDCVIFLVDTKNKLLIQKAACGNKSPENEEIFQPIFIPLGKGITGTVALTGIAEIIIDTSQDIRYIPEGEVRLSEISVPIKIDDDVVGVIDCENPNKNFFTTEHLNILSAISSICGTKLRWIRAQKEVHKRDEKLQKIRGHLAQMRVQAMYSQLNPHFIFNSLTVIQENVLMQNNDFAVRYLEDFGRLLRRILSYEKKYFVTLNEEVEFLKLHLKMESMRFDFPFSWEVIIDDSVDGEIIKIPPMLFHPIIEQILWRQFRYLERTAQTIMISFLTENKKIVYRVEYFGISDKCKLLEGSNFQQIKDRIKLLNRAFNFRAKLREQVLNNGPQAQRGQRIEIVFT
jgi:LytS/YehU family sensor histidine kinase